MEEFQYKGYRIKPGKIERKRYEKKDAENDGKVQTNEVFKNDEQFYIRLRIADFDLAKMGYSIKNWKELLPMFRNGTKNVIDKFEDGREKPKKGTILSTMSVKSGCQLMRSFSLSR